MIERTEHDDVTAVRLHWWRSRMAGYQVYVYLVRGVLIDSGFPGALRDLAALIDERRPRGAFITHSHEDHAGNVELLASRGVPITMHAHTEANVRQPSSIGLYRHIVWRAMPALRSATTAFHDDTLSLLPTPGHSADHQSVWDATTDTLFAGDLFLGVKVRIAHAYERPEQHVASIRAMLARRPARVFCMHRGLLPNGTSLLAAKADWIESVIGDSRRLHDDGKSVQEIRDIVLGGRNRDDIVSFGDYSTMNLIRGALRATSSAHSVL